MKIPTNPSTIFSCKIRHGKKVIIMGDKNPKIEGNLTDFSGKLATKIAIIPKNIAENKKSIMSRFCI